MIEMIIFLIGEYCYFQKVFVPLLRASSSVRNGVQLAINTSLEI